MKPVLFVPGHIQNLSNGAVVDLTQNLTVRPRLLSHIYIVVHLGDGQIRVLALLLP